MATVEPAGGDQEYRDENGGEAISSSMEREEGGKSAAAGENKRRNRLEALAKKGEIMWTWLQEVATNLPATVDDDSLFCTHCCDVLLQPPLLRARGGSQNLLFKKPRDTCISQVSKV